MIKVENLTKSFGELEVLKGINQEIKDGEVVVVIGPSGSGKSTFLRCLNLLEEPTSGKIFVDNEEITSRDIDINKVREEMGMVFQSFNLFNNLNIIDNITHNIISKLIHLTIHLIIVLALLTITYNTFKPATSFGQILNLNMVVDYI